MTNTALCTEGDRDDLASLVVGAERMCVVFVSDGKTIEGVKAEI